MMKLIIRRLFPRRYENIVAPLQKITEDLVALQEQNNEDNRLDNLVIAKLQNQVSARHAESAQASATRSRILALLAHN